MSYGYQERPEMPDRFIRSPGQAEPRSAWPRKIGKAVKDGAGDTSFFQLLYTLQADRTPLIGSTSLLEAGSSDGSRTSSAWYSRIARFCSRVNITHGTGEPVQYYEERVRFDIWPVAMVDSTMPRCPFVFRFEDVMAFDVSYTGSGSGALHFGLFNDTVTAALTPQEQFIGFTAAVTDPGGGAGYGTWTARANKAAVAGFSSETATTSEDPHRLAIEIDGGSAEVRYYIDGTLVATAAQADLDLEAFTTESHVGWRVIAGGSGTHSNEVTAGYWIDNQALISVRVLDEAA